MNRTSELYYCKYCESVSTTKEWNEETRKYFNLIVPVEEAKKSTFFTCPNCKHTVPYPIMIKVKEMVSAKSQ